MNPHLFSGLDPHTKHMIVTQIVVGIYNKTSCTDPGQYLQTYHDVWEKWSHNGWTFSCQSKHIRVAWSMAIADYSIFPRCLSCYGRSSPIDFSNA